MNIENGDFADPPFDTMPEDVETMTKDEPETTEDMVDNLQKRLGGYGRYQMIIYCILGIVYMRGCWHALVPIFQNLDPGYHCRPAPGLTLNESVPGHRGSDGSWVYESCLQYVNESASNATESCSRGWDYMFDNSHSSSIVSEYDLTCDRSYLADLTTTLYMVGTTSGVVFLTPITERFGAKRMMLACLWLQAVVGTVMPWAGSITIFMMLEFFIGVFNMTIALCVAVQMSETFDSNHREIPVIGTSFFWAVGIMSLSLFAYLLPNWKHLQLVITLPINVASVLFIWVIPHTLPWLISKGRWKEAYQTIDRFTTFNKLPSIENLEDKLLAIKSNSKIMDSQNLPENSSLQSDSSVQTFTVFHVFKYSKLRRYAVILCYLFLSNALAYFGIIYSTPELNGNIYLNLFFSGLVEVPAYALSILSHRIIGRRRSISIFLLVCAIANIIMAFVPANTPSAIKTILFLVGKFGITGSYSAIYLYASEIFPTVIRNQGVGFCSFFENIGSIAAPLMVYANEKLAYLPLIVFGGMTILGSVLTMLLPETHQKPLPQTIEDVEGSKDVQSDPKPELVM